MQYQASAEILKHFHVSCGILEALFLPLPPPKNPLRREWPRRAA
jgi:hypothetical protein